MRKRLSTRITARRKQDILADIEDMAANLLAMLEAQVGELEQRIMSVIGPDEPSAAKARLLLSLPGIGPVSAALLSAEMPALGRMTSGKAAAMTGLAPIPHDNGAMRGKRAITGGRRALRHVLFQAARAAADQNPVLKPVAQSLKRRGKSQKLVTISNAILKNRRPCLPQPSR